MIGRRNRHSGPAALLAVAKCHFRTTDQVLEEKNLSRKALGPEAAFVTPGIRPAGSAVNDQKRVLTPGEAGKKLDEATRTRAGQRIQFLNTVIGKMSGVVTDTAFPSIASVTVALPGAAAGSSQSDRRRSSPAAADPPA